jgi:hypothetical protein
MTQKARRLLRRRAFLNFRSGSLATSIQTDSPAHLSRDDDGGDGGDESAFCYEDIGPAKNCQ